MSREWLLAHESWLAWWRPAGHIRPSRTPGSADDGSRIYKQNAFRRISSQSRLLFVTVETDWMSDSVAVADFRHRSWSVSHFTSSVHADWFITLCLMNNFDAQLGMFWSERSWHCLFALLRIVQKCNWLRNAHCVGKNYVHRILGWKKSEELSDVYMTTKWKYVYWICLEISRLWQNVQKTCVVLISRCWTVTKIQTWSLGTASWSGSDVQKTHSLWKNFEINLVISPERFHTLPDFAEGFHHAQTTRETVTHSPKTM